MKSISSRDNSLYKELKQLATSAQARRKTGRTLLDGVHLCEAYLQHVGLPLQCVVSESAVHHVEVAPLIARLDLKKTVCVVLADALFRAISQVEHGIDLLFVVDVPRVDAPQGLTESVVLLDKVQDPGNLGSILRSAAAAGIRHVFCSAGTALCWSPKVLRAGMGAHFLLKIIESADLATLIRSSQVPVLATSSHVHQHLYDIDLTQPVAWLFGHEGQGVAEELMALATHRVAIPQLGAMESLNVAACAAICFFEQVRQKMYRD